MGKFVEKRADIFQVQKYVLFFSPAISKVADYTACNNGNVLDMSGTFEVATKHSKINCYEQKMWYNIMATTH